jgi:hypothetical protein
VEINFAYVCSITESARYDDDDDYYDLQWVPALTVPMHLGLTDRPLVPHNLISAQDTPVSLPKFQMDPRF